MELWPIPVGIPAVRYMFPTARRFRPSLASFIRPTVTPRSEKVCTPALASAPSCHSRNCALWETAVERVVGLVKLATWRLTAGSFSASYRQFIVQQQECHSPETLGTFMDVLLSPYRLHSLSLAKSKNALYSPKVQTKCFCDERHSLHHQSQQHSVTGL